LIEGCLTRNIYKTGYRELDATEGWINDNRKENENDQLTVEGRTESSAKQMCLRERKPKIIDCKVQTEKRHTDSQAMYTNTVGHEGQQAEQSERRVEQKAT
jgi:hypothetical protein